MRGRSRQKVIRLFLGAVLSSDLSPQDLHELQYELEDGDLHRELAYMLRGFAMHIGTQEEPRSRSSGSITGETLFNAAKKKRVPKSGIIELIKSLAGKRFEFDQDASIREMLSNFAEVMPENLSSQFLDVLELSASSGDPYLRGILDRKKEV